ncbi:hypothetical protein C8R44DRAFT_752757 [Mycena epipterygia]|nr:hypothetical protein C8R44DRAFT_752757 [Mycena epipterygia]
MTPFASAAGGYTRRGRRGAGACVRADVKWIRGGGGQTLSEDENAAGRALFSSALMPLIGFGGTGTQAQRRAGSQRREGRLAEEGPYFSICVARIHCPRWHQVNKIEAEEKERQRRDASRELNTRSGRLHLSSTAEHSKYESVTTTSQRTHYPGSRGGDTALSAASVDDGTGSDFWVVDIREEKGRGGYKEDGGTTALLISCSLTEPISTV